MGLINGGLQIGRTAIQANQAALQIVGNNIANASNPNYSRQVPRIQAVTTGQAAQGLSGGQGVQMAGVGRLADEVINARLRDATGDQAAAKARSDLLTQVETVLDALGDDNLVSRMTALFNAFSDLANEPESAGRRELVLQQAGSLARTIRSHYAAVQDIRASANDQIRALTQTANVLLAQAADLNAQITAVEFGQVQATSGNLRDRRDQVLGQLSELLNITTRTGENGAINVFVGSAPLVMAGTAVLLDAATDVSGGAPDVVVKLTCSGQTTAVSGGKIGGLLAARDQGVRDALEKLDRLAAALIQEVNRLHAEGQGLGGLASVSGDQPVRDAAAALNAAGLAIRPVNGTFELAITDAATGTRTTHVVEVDLDGVGADCTLASLAAAIDGLDGVSARINGDNTLTIAADSGYRIGFANDSSGVLAALGVNTLFSGRGAADIAVGDSLTTSHVAAATNHLPHDNSNALRLADLADRPLDLLGGASLRDFYINTVTALAVESAGASAESDASQLMADTLTAQRQAISGVSIDEEAIDMMRYQRAFEGAARYLSLVNELLDEIMRLI